MNALRTWMLGLIAPCLILSPYLASYSNADNCTLPAHDYGDAPECTAAYADGTVGHFPTCVSSPCEAGDQDFTAACAPIPPAPGLTGYVFHADPDSLPNNFALGCGPVGLELAIDSETDGKANSPSTGSSACDDTLTPDCVEAAVDATTFDQDECYDDPEAGITEAIVFLACDPAATVDYEAFLCSLPSIHAYLNVLVDWNGDGDWNDVVECGATCVYEWAVQNELIDLATGCNDLTSPTFHTGPDARASWLRISLTAFPVPDDFPWAGSASVGLFFGGETEDYPVSIAFAPVAIESTSWGRIKSVYR